MTSPIFIRAYKITFWIGTSLGIGNILNAVTEINIGYVPSAKYPYESAFYIHYYDTILFWGIFAPLIFRAVFMTIHYLVYGKFRFSKMTTPAPQHVEQKAA